MDRPSLGKPSPISIDGVLHVHKGMVLGFFSNPVGTKDSNKAELLAVVKALELSSLRNDKIGRKIIVEYDSSNVVNWMHKTYIRPWYYYELFILATCFSSLMGSVLFTHTLREINHMANSLVKQRGQ
jgi:ribonuclease HI